MIKKEITIQVSATLIQALHQMDEVKHKVLLAFDGDSFVSILTIGDVQRAIIYNTDMSVCVGNILRPETKSYCKTTQSIDEIKAEMLRIRCEIMPVVDDKGKLVEVYFWDELFGSDEDIPKQQLNIPVVIMAGGKGTRLAPLTNIYPKPLIPIGEKTIVETIMDKFVSYGCNDFYMSVNYKADMIKNYFNFIHNDSYNISYFQEDRPMGTAGSLRLLKDKLNSTFFVSNCDIMIYDDFANILNYHKENHNELTVVAAVKTLSIPYGTIQTKEDGLLESIEEKPDLSFKINTGLYILEPTLLNDIPDEFFHITHLMEKLHNEGRRVGVYPISQNDWMDMGDWNEYLKMIKVR